MILTQKKRLVVLAIVLVLCAIVIVMFWPKRAKSPNQEITPGVLPSGVVPSISTTSAPVPSATTISKSAPLVDPLSNALGRVTKKPFGIYVTPTNSPVSPEKFTGYHTGVDFEIYPSEQNTDVPVAAVCDGPLKFKKWASGYGGVVVQACQLDGQDVTIIYGHLNVNTITPNVGEQITAGEKIASLGQGYSQQTDGERKHLHLGIHKGTAINILGYVQNKSELSGWLDAAQYLR